MQTHLGHGRGTLAYRPEGVFAGIHVDLPNPMRMIMSTGDQLAELAQDTSNVLTLAALVGAPFTGGASLALLEPAGALAAGASLYRLVDRAQRRTFQLDAEAWNDLIGVAAFALGGAVRGLGQAAVAARAAGNLERAARLGIVITGGHVGLWLLEGGGYVVMAYQTYAAIADADASADGRQREIEALLSALENVGVGTAGHAHAATTEPQPAANEQGYRPIPGIDPDRPHGQGGGPLTGATGAVEPRDIVELPRGSNGPASSAQSPAHPADQTRETEQHPADDVAQGATRVTPSTGQSAEPSLRGGPHDNARDPAVGGGPGDPDHDPTTETQRPTPEQPSAAARRGQYHALSHAELLELFTQTYRRPGPSAESYRVHASMEDFAQAWRSSHPSNATTPPPTGFYDPNTNLIHLPPDASVLLAIHESLHWAGNQSHSVAEMGSFFEEGMVEVLTRREFGPHGFRTNYDQHVAFIRLLTSVVSEATLERAFLHGAWSDMHSALQEHLGSPVRVDEFLGHLRAVGADGEHGERLGRAMDMLWPGSAEPSSHEAGTATEPEHPSTSPVAGPGPTPGVASVPGDSGYSYALRPRESAQQREQRVLARIGAEDLATYEQRLERIRAAVDAEASRTSAEADIGLYTEVQWRLEQGRRRRKHQEEIANQERAGIEAQRELWSNLRVNGRRVTLEQVNAMTEEQLDALRQEVSAAPVMENKQRVLADLDGRIEKHSHQREREQARARTNGRGETDERLLRRILGGALNVWASDRDQAQRIANRLENMLQEQAYQPSGGAAFEGQERFAVHGPESHRGMNTGTGMDIRANTAPDDVHINVQGTLTVDRRRVDIDVHIYFPDNTAERR